eukprot:TRINITY_DN50331_c0_g2_i1.p1 TRINITY_DN50331_c0_g2~~TRINITY_DN50331_c0_g2_i1.p1  ORF type:complete len:221 (-),score=71.49 TRINITY_DN50331_c0_g2_i1:152-814(-)
MLRSLVGSEMCIRDRPESTQPGAVAEKSSEPDKTPWRAGLKQAKLGQVSDKTLRQILPFSSFEAQDYSQTLDSTGHLQLSRETKEDTRLARVKTFKSLEHQDEVVAYFNELTGGEPHMTTDHLIVLLKDFFKQASFYHNDLSTAQAARMAESLMSQVFGQSSEGDEDPFITVEMFGPWYHDKRYDEWPAFIAQIEETRTRKAGSSTRDRRSSLNLSLIHI